MSFGFDPHAPPATPRDAATVVLLREGPGGLEIFFVRRAAGARFMGGAYVFPGGKLDEGDLDPDVPCDLDASGAAALLGEHDEARARALWIAAARECFEEAGVLFSREPLDPAVITELRAVCNTSTGAFASALRSRGITLGISSLQPFARWVTPRGESRRFDARFFLAVAPAGAQASHDASETVDSAWLTPHEALRRAVAGTIVLAPPTFHTVELLSRCADLAHALRFAPAAIPCFEPVVHFDEDGTVTIALPGDPLHPLPEPVEARPGTIGIDSMTKRFRLTDGLWQPARPGP